MGVEVKSLAPGTFFLSLLTDESIVDKSSIKYLHRGSFTDIVLYFSVISR